MISKNLEKTTKSIKTNDYILSNNKITEHKNNYILSKKQEKNLDYTRNTAIRNDLALLKSKYSLSNEELFNIVQKEPIEVPVSIFCSKTSPLESLVKYLKENKGLSFAKIGTLLSRDDRTIWTEYHAAVEKDGKLFTIPHNDILIDISKFADRKYPVLEVLCDYLMGKGHKINEISSLLKKHRNTIATAIKRHASRNKDHAKKGERR